MTEREPAEAIRKMGEAFGESYRKAAENVAEAQQRNVRLAQGWVEGVGGMLESQAEANRALTTAMESHAKVVKESLESQERTNRVLAESLDSYRQVAEKFGELQEKNTELTRNLFEGIRGELENQAKAAQDNAREMMEGSGKQLEAFQEMFQEAMGSYTDLMNAPFSLYQKNLEAFRRGGK